MTLTKDELETVKVALLQIHWHDDSPMNKLYDKINSYLESLNQNIIDKA